MKSILVFVSTLDGKVTRWGDPQVWSWSSKEDQHYFKKLWEGSRLIIMGSSTYNADPVHPTANQLVVIMTRNLLNYKREEVAGQLEFSNESAERLHDRFLKAGFERMLVVGGPHVATTFLQKQLIDEVWITIEPRIFGTGGGFVIEEKLDIRLQLLSCERVNEQGTMITKYAVVKDQNMNA